MTTKKPRILEQIEEKEAELLNVELDKYWLAPWSVSKLKSLEKCPYQFYLKYIVKVKPDDLVQDTAMADVGTIAHKILEYIALGKSVEEAYAIVKKVNCSDSPPPWKSKEPILNEEDWSNKIATLEMSIMDFKAKLDKFQEGQGVRRVLSELRLAVTKDWEKTSFFANNVYFRGVIDLVIEMVNDDALVIDHKHGGGEFGGLKNYEMQLDSYRPLLHFGEKKTNGIQVGVNFIKENRLVMGEYTDREDIEKKYVAKLEWLLTCAVDSVREIGFFKHIRGNHCKYCEFDAPCKEGLLKDNEKKTIKWFPKL